MRTNLILLAVLMATVACTPAMLNSLAMDTGSGGGALPVEENETTEEGIELTGEEEADNEVGVCVIGVESPCNGEFWDNLPFGPITPVPPTQFTG